MFCHLRIKYSSFIYSLKNNYEAEIIVSIPGVGV